MPLEPTPSFEFVKPPTTSPVRVSILLVYMRALMDAALKRQRMGELPEGVIGTVKRVRQGRIPEANEA
jgi:hypothetical protein